jgi:hypothetical protein
MTAAELAQLLTQSAKGITYERLEKLKGAVARENNHGNMITFEQVIAHLTPDQQAEAAKALLGKGRDA